MNDLHLWWYVTRASALVAWITLTLAVLWGVLLSTRIPRTIADPAWLQDMHRWLGGTALIMTGLHMFSLVLDSWSRFSLTAVLVPLSAAYRPWPVALGVVAFYLLLAVYGSSLLRARMSPRWWTRLHYGSYAAVVLVSFHAGWSGTDAGTWGYRLTALILVVSTMAAVLTRVLRGVDRPPASRRTPRRPRSAPQPMTVDATHLLASGIVGIDLTPRDGDELPVWTPGAHVTVHLPNGLERRYSLCGDPADRTRYRIAVHRAPHSRGGSSWLHASARPGTVLHVGLPENHFPLEPALEYLFLAGGIGITPIKAMIESLPAHRRWRLIYLGRSRATMAFCEELEQRWPQNVSIHAHDETGSRLDLTPILAAATAGAVYCCGPASMTDAVAARVSPARLHLERFTAAPQQSSGPGRPIEITCSRSDRLVHVSENQSVLDALEHARVPVVASCREGMCGACETRVLAGDIEHLDSVPRTPGEERRGVMYPCVSRAHSPTLVLDL